MPLASSRRGRGIASAPRLSYNHTGSACIAAASACLLLACSQFPIAQAVSIGLPAQFVQCQSAVISLNNLTGGPVKLSIKSVQVSSDSFTVSIPAQQPVYEWNKVDFSAGSQFVVSAVEDLSSMPASSKNTAGADFAQAMAYATISPSPSNDTSCLTTSSHRHSEAARKSHKDQHSAMLAAVLSILGALLLFFIFLTLCVCIRRRKEANTDKLSGGVAGYSPVDPSEHTAWSNTLTQSAGWNYMARLVPGLTANEATTPRPRRATRRGFFTRRYEDTSGELPTYGQSEKDVKGPPTYNMPLLCDHQEPPEVARDSVQMRDHSDRTWPDPTIATYPEHSYMPREDDYYTCSASFYAPRSSHPPSPEIHQLTSLRASHGAYHVNTDTTPVRTLSDENRSASFNQRSAAARTGDRTLVEVLAVEPIQDFSPRPRHTSMVSSTARGVRTTRFLHGPNSSFSTIQLAPEVPDKDDTPATQAS